MKIVFMGTPAFAVKPLEAIIKSGKHQVVAVVCQIDKIGNRNKMEECAVKRYAIYNKLPLYQFANVSTDGADILQQLDADIFITCAYGQKLSQQLIDMTKYGIINIHGSLLPKYRGAAPIQWSVINGEEYGGVTIMKTAYAMDAGDILIKDMIDIKGDDTASSMFVKLSLLSAQLIIKALDLISSGRAVFVPQDETLVTKCYKLTTKNTQVMWNKNALQIHNLVRGCNDDPVAWAMLNGQIVKIWLTSVYENELVANEAGLVLCADKKGIVVACGQGTIKILQMQFPGGKKLNYLDVVNGRKVVTGMRFN